MHLHLKKQGGELDTFETILFHNKSLQTGLTWSFPLCPPSITGISHTHNL